MVATGPKMAAQIRAPPPPPPAEKKRELKFKVVAPRVHKLLYIQREDGGWDLDEQALACMRLSEGLIKKNAEELVAEKEAEKEEVEAVFCTSIVLELARQGKEYCDATPMNQRVFSTSLMVPEMVARTAVRRGAFKEWKEMAEAFLSRAESGLREGARRRAEAVVLERLQAVTSKKMCMECRQEFTSDKKHCPGCLLKERVQHVEPSSETFQMDFSLPSRQDIENVPWAEVKGFHWISGGLGSVGAFLCQIGEELVMAKSGGTAAVREFFGNRLMEKLGVPVARTRPFLSHSEEGLALRLGLRGAASTNEGEACKAYFVRKYPIIFSMEYIGGGREMCMPRPELERLQTASPGSLWEQCGRVAACDVFMNNYDRFPVIWNNLGNAANVIIRELPATNDCAASVCVTAIDQACLPIMDVANRQAYMAKVEEVVRMTAAAVSDAEGATSIAARAVREGPMRQMAGFANTYLGGPINDENFFAFLRGFDGQITRIVERMTPAASLELQQEVEVTFPTGAALAADAFLADVHAAMAAGLA
mmetsp:Transcript_19587/g.75191  ORF Transcript_19587/g.75191 Transcript_19587/m.75191 type:complete len:536 (+) Transcript_19587:66-1673(+)